MNACDLEEIKHVALQKFVEEFKDISPSVWKYLWCGMLSYKASITYKDWKIRVYKEGKKEDFVLYLCGETLGRSLRNPNAEWAVICKAIAEWNEENMYATWRKEIASRQQATCKEIQAALGMNSNKRLTLISWIKRFWK